MSRVFIAAIVMTVIPVTAQTPAAPMLPDANPEWYQRRDTWQETVRLSREAIAQHLAARPTRVGAIAQDAGTGHVAKARMKPLLHAIFVHALFVGVGG